MKRFFAIGLVLMFCFSLFGCSYNFTLHDKKHYTVELIVKGTSADFWKRVNDGAQAAAAACDAQVEMSGPQLEENCSDQITYMQQAIERQPDAIVLAATDYFLMAQPVQNAIDAGIPVIMVDSDVASDRTVSYVGTDNEELGRRLAHQVSDNVKDGGKIGLVSFVQKSYPAVQREVGFRTIMESQNSFEMLDTLYCASDTDQAYELVKELLKREPEMAAVAALNAQSAEGTARALSEASSNIPLYTIDCMPEEAMYMEEGVIKSALLQNPYQMGYFSVITAYKHLNGEEVESIYTDIYTITPDVLFDNIYQQLIFPFE